MLNRRIFLGHAAALLAVPSFARAAAAGLRNIRFASVDQGRAVLGADDDWVAATSEFHRRATLGVTTPVSRETLRAFCADSVLAWNDALTPRWNTALATIGPRLDELRMPLPPDVLLIRSNGRDSAGAPYTRANAVVLPIQGMPNNPRADAFILAHELFHVASRNAPELATKLYALLGFEPTAPLQWPAEWAPLRIANPDAPHDRHLMRTTLNGRALALMPLLVARRDTLQPGETFFSVLDVRLLEVEPGPNGTQPVRRNGTLAWHQPDSVPEYLARLGGNTGYIFHPEETMADNVAALVTGAPVPNQALLRKIEAVLLANPR